MFKTGDKTSLNYGKSKYKNTLKAYDNKILDLSTEEIVNTAKGLEHNQRALLTYSD